MCSPTVVAGGDKLPLAYFTVPASTSSSLADMANESAALFRLAVPTILTALLLYSRSAVSLLFLGSLGDLPLAAGALAIAFANITGYSVLSGLALGMEPLCSQAFGAKNPKLLCLTLHRCIIFLLCCSMPITFLWLHMSKILLFLGQDPEITGMAQSYLVFSLPDLISFSFLHPLRIYLRSQEITLPLTAAAAAAAAFHVPANLFLITHLGLGAPGVAAAAAASNFAFLFFLLFFARHSAARPGAIPASAAGEVFPSFESLTGWGSLARLAAPSCVSVCLEWWWYELIILLCGLLPEPRPAVAAMGVLIQTTSLLYVFPSSLSFAVSTRVGNALGANQPHRARTAAHVVVAWAVALGLGAVAFSAAVQHRWGRMFTGDDDIIRLTVEALPIIGLCELGNCPQTVGCGVLRGSARPACAARINVGAFYLVGMPVAVGAAFWLGVGFRGLWLGLLAAQACCAVMMLSVVAGTDWEAQARRAQVLAAAGVNAVVEEDNMTGDGEETVEEDKHVWPLIVIGTAGIER